MTAKASLLSTLGTIRFDIQHVNKSTQQLLDEFLFEQKHTDII